MSQPGASRTRDNLNPAESGEFIEMIGGLGIFHADLDNLFDADQRFIDEARFTQFPELDTCGTDTD